MMKHRSSLELNDSGSISWSHHEYYYMKFASQNMIDRPIISRWLKYSLIIIISSIISMVWKLIFDRYQIDYNKTYEQIHKLYYINDSILMIISSISILAFVLIFIDDTLHGLIIIIKKMCFITFILYTLILAISLLSFLVRDSIQGVVNHESSSFCSSFICDEFTIYDIWIYVLNPGLLPIIMLMSTTLFFSLCKMKIPSRNRNNTSITQNTNIDDLELGLLAHNDDFDDNNTVLEDIQTTTNKYTCYILYLLFYFISLLLYFAASNINISVLESQFEVTYIIVLCIISIYKHMMKLIGRLCDHFRFRSSDYNFYLSLEYLTEWIYGLMYWIWLRNNWMYHQPSLGIFILQLVLTHILTEIIATNIKYSKCYYRFIHKLLDKYSAKHGKFEHLMQFILSDAINIDVYKTHLGICIITRFYIAVITGFIHLIYLLIVGPKSIEDFDENKFNKNNYYEAMFHGLLLLIYEIVYYGMTFQVEKHKLILRSFTDYIYPMSTIHKTLLLIIYLSFLPFLWNSR